MFAVSTTETPAEERPVQGTSHRRAVIGAVVSLVSIAGCVWWASGQDIPPFPSSASGIAMLAAGVALYAVATLARGWRWHTIMHRAEIEHQRTDTYALTAVGYMGNTVLPARGGEVLRIFLLSERSSARAREILGSIIPERMLDAGVLALLFAVLVFAGTHGSPGQWAAFVAAGIVVALIVGAVVYLRLRIAGRMEQFAERVRPFAKASRLLLRPAGLALAALTAAIWVLEGMILWLCARSLSIHIGLNEAILVDALASLSALIPAGPGYIGTYDAAALFALHGIGVQGGDAVGIVVLFRAVVFVPITLVGLGLMVGRYGGLRGALRREHAALADPDTP